MTSKAATTTERTLAQILDGLDIDVKINDRTKEGQLLVATDPKDVRRALAAARASALCEDRAGEAVDGRQQITITPDELRQIARQAAPVLRRYKIKGEDLRVITTSRTVLVISTNCKPGAPR